MNQPLTKGILTASFNRYVELGSAEPFEQFAVTGVFARYDASDSDTVNVLWDMYSIEPDINLDECAVPAPVLEQSRISYSRNRNSIELLDVGDLNLTLEGQRKQIPTRTFPDLLKAIVGVMYAVDDTQGVTFRPGETYDVRASGTDAVSRFRVALDAPEDLGEVTVNGTVPGEETPTLVRGRQIDLTWSGDGYGDEVIAALSWTAMGSPWSVVCRMRDDGAFVIPRSVTRELPDALTSTDAEIQLRRVRQVAFRSKELSGASFRFVVSTSFPVAF